MAGHLLTVELWNEIGPLFPQHQQSRKGGRPLIDNRSVFTYLLFLLKTSIGLRELPTDEGASKKPVTRRFELWIEQRLWQRIFSQLLARLRAARRLDLGEVLVDADSSRLRAEPKMRPPTPPIVAESVVN